MTHLDTSFLVDLLIAATALGDDAALGTRNTRDFERVPGLRIIGY